jgi:adenine-specific DNA-methyltransferase
LKCNGIVKGNIVEFSERPVSRIPFRVINWNDNEEIAWHNNITNLSKQYIETKNDIYLKDINYTINQLIGE